MDKTALVKGDYVRFSFLDSILDSISMLRNLSWRRCRLG
jgi:hypothetical protein